MTNTPPYSEHRVSGHVIRPTEASEIKELASACVSEHDLELLFDREGRIWPALTRFAASLLNDRTEAEDVAQETCQRVLLAIRTGARIHPKALFRYCHTTAYRLVINRWNGRRWKDEDLAEDPIQEEVGSSRAEESSPADKAEARILVEYALARLNKNERTVLELTLVGYEDSEIMKTLDITSANNVRQIRYRAVRRLRRILADEFSTEVDQLTGQILTGKEGIPMM